MSKRALSFVLLVPETESRHLEALSTSLAALGDSRLTLGEGCLPHVTLLQFEAEPSDAMALWEETQSQIVDQEIELDLAGFCILPAPDDSEVWLEVPVLNSEALRNMQEGLMGLTGVHDREVFNGTGDNFRPHITVGLFQDLPDRLPGDRIVGSLVRRRIRGRLALGITGDNYSLIEVLRSAGA